MITLPNNYFAVLIPEAGIEEISIHHGHLFYMYKEYASSSESDMQRKIPLPPGSYTIVGLATSITEEQAEKIVDHRYEYGYKHHGGILICKDYVTGEALPTALESFSSLLRSLNLQPETSLIICKN